MKSIKFASIISVVAIACLGLLTACNLFTEKSGSGSSESAEEGGSEELPSIEGTWATSIKNEGSNFTELNDITFRFEADSTFVENIKVTAESTEMENSYMTITGNVSVEGTYTFDGNTLRLVYDENTISNQLITNEGFGSNSNESRKEKYARQKIATFRNHSVDPRNFINVSISGNTLSMENEGKIYRFEKEM